MGEIGLVVLIGSLTFFQVGDGDFWTHLRTGAWIVQHRSVPHANLYLYTSQGYPWICHTWLTSVVFYFLHNPGGLAANQICELLCVVASFALLYHFHLRAGSSRPLGLILFALGIGAARSRFDIRPEIFSGVLFAALLYLLFDFKMGNRRNLWIVLIITVLWTNFHGTVVTATLVLCIFAGGEAIQRFLHRRWGWIYPHELSAEQLRHVVILAALTVATMVINPYGLHYFESLAPSRLAMLDRYLTEWRPLRELIVGFDWTTLGLMILFTLAIVHSFIHARRSLNLSCLFLFFVFTYLTIKSSRQIWTWVQLSLCIAAINYSIVGKEHGAPMRACNSYESHDRALTRIASSPAVALLVVAVAIFQAIYFSLACGYSYGFGLDSQFVPVGAVRFIEQNRLYGRLFNDEIDSGYLSWKLYPRQKLFIDGMNAYGAELFTAAQALRGDVILPESFERWDFDVCLIPNKPYFRSLLQLLRSRNDWALVYWDGISFVYLKNIPRFASVVARERYRFADPSFEAFVPENARKRFCSEIERAVRNPVKSAALYTAVGDLYLSARDLGAAERSYVEALEMRSNDIRAMVGLARTERLRKKLQLAEQWCRRALFFQPQLPEAWRVLGLTQAQEAAQASGNLDLLRNAAHSLEKAIARGAGEDFETDQQLSLAYLQLGQFAKARLILERLVRDYPHSAITWYGLAVALKYETPLPQERIIECLRKAIAYKPAMRVLIRNDQTFAPLRDNPQFRAIMRD